jgi:hypothetical protein
MFALAEALGKTAAEIEQITIEEWYHWLAYLKLKHEKSRNIGRR